MRTMASWLVFTLALSCPARASDDRDNRERQTLDAALSLAGSDLSGLPITLTVPSMPRVRTSQPVIAALIEQGRARSTTFRELLEAIEASDGIVYIEGGRRCHGRRACLVFSVTVAGPNRILHVLVGGRGTDRELMADIGHELQHGIEVLSDPTVTSDGAMYQF
jgi:hypothetical protein